MSRLLTGLCVAGLLAGAVIYSQSPVRTSAVELRVQVDAANPWNHLRVNNNPDEFHFALVSDRTGSARPGVFERSIDQLNLLLPEFVISVGDLIEGLQAGDKGLDQSKQLDKVNAQWQEFNGFIRRLHMPFFYVPGNHDIQDSLMEKRWREMFGRRHYHFVYRKVLFLLLNSEDPPGEGPGHFGKEQIAYVKKALADNKDVRWTIVVMHKRPWTSSKLAKTGWLDIEEALGQRPYTVFAGHIHIYEKHVRNGRNYYVLATTGGGSKLRGVPFGEFDHITWVTMKKDGPVLANLLLEGIFPEDLSNLPKK